MAKNNPENSIKDQTNAQSNYPNPEISTHPLSKEMVDTWIDAGNVVVFEEKILRAPLPDPLHSNAQFNDLSKTQKENDSVMQLTAELPLDQLTINITK